MFRHLRSGDPESFLQLLLEESNVSIPLPSKITNFRFSKNIC